MVAGLAAGLLLAACSAKDSASDSASAAGAAQPDTAQTQRGAGPAPTPAKADSQMQSVLDELGSLGGKPIEALAPAEARKQPTPTDAVKSLLRKQGRSVAPEPGVTAVDRTIPGAAGRIAARVYTPAAGAAPFPVIVYYHGGGWVIANKEVYDAGPRALAKAVGAVVISVDYRQGPEHKFPAAHDDAVAAYEWVAANARSIRGDSTRLALAGESAGGGLAVATAIAARDRQMTMPRAIVSVYPIAGSDTTTPSYVENATAKPLNRPMMSWFFEHYLRSPADRQDPRINLIDANLAGLPPTLILNAQIDPLRSEGEMLAQRLRAAGVSVEQRTYEGTAHEFFGMAAVVDKARDAQAVAAESLRRAFAKP